MAEPEKPPDGIPRRACLWLLTPEERAIREAMIMVEAMPGDVRLSHAVSLLCEAQDRVADFIDHRGDGLCWYKNWQGWYCKQLYGHEGEHDWAPMTDEQQQLTLDAFHAPSEEMGKAAVLVAQRPQWDEVWMSLAHQLSLRSSCKRAQVGCALVSSDNCRVLAIGYNGGARGLENGCLSDEPGKCGHLHAEVNALLKLDYNESAQKVAYVTMEPCYLCAVALVNAGVHEVVYRDEYRDHSGLELLAKAYVRVRRVSLEGSR